MAEAKSSYGEQVAIPVVVDLLLRPKKFVEVLKEKMDFGRNPCCSGPTPSTHKSILGRKRANGVAIPVVVDLLLRPGTKHSVLRIERSQSLL